MVNVRNILVALISLASILISCTGKVESPEITRVLILSGQNNHEWQKTSPLIEEELQNSGLFSTFVTNNPDTLTFNNLKSFDVIVSNWNKWPDTSFRLDRKWEKDLTRFIKKGGGFVSIHAGSSLFYGWDDFRRIGIGRWSKNTSHGQITIGRIGKFDQSHPVTKGLKEFYITDEFWENTEIVPGARSIALVSAEVGSKDKPINEPVLFFNLLGQGRCIYLALGHDIRAIRNTGFKTLLIRSSLWAAHRKINNETIPCYLKNEKSVKEDHFSWGRTDSSFFLKNNSCIVWQLNFNDRFGKPYFHPVSAKNSILTCVSPSDHPWHLGLWFSWKFINGVNYWEFTDNKISEAGHYNSDGLTELKDIEIKETSDFSCNISMNLNYRPRNGNSVLSEKRSVIVFPPENDGSFTIDFESVFTPAGYDVTLDRTPIVGEPEGKSWGGYAGLSVRFSQDLTLSYTIPEKMDNDLKYSNWYYMGFNTLTGDTAGICIFKNPYFSTKTSRWYVIEDTSIPFFYYSPALLYDGKIILKANENLHLKYRIWIMSQKADRDRLVKKYNEYLKEM